MALTSHLVTNYLGSAARDSSLNTAGMRKQQSREVDTRIRNTGYKMNR